MATGDLYQVVIKGDQNGQQTNNVLHFRATSGDADAFDLADAVQECLSDGLIAALAGDWAGVNVTAKRVWPTAGLESVVDLSEFTGEGAGGTSPHDAAIISFRTELPGKSGRGRMYLAGLPEAQVTAGRVQSVFQAAVVAFVACMFGKFIDGTMDYEWGVLSRKNFLATPGTPASWWGKIQDAVLDPVVGTMRSRKIGRGV